MPMERLHLNICVVCKLILWIPFFYVEAVKVNHLITVVKVQLPFFKIEQQKGREREWERERERVRERQRVLIVYIT
jgi:hypothetical protein